MKDIFLNAPQKENIRKWKPNNVNLSLSSRLFNYLWDFSVKYIPSDIAPNVLSVMGLLCNLHAFYLCKKKMKNENEIQDGLKGIKKGSQFTKNFKIITKFKKNKQNFDITPFFKIKIHSKIKI